MLNRFRDQIKNLVIYFLAEKQNNMRGLALKSHDQKGNSERLMTTYNEIKG